MRILEFQNYPASVKLTNLQQKVESSTASPFKAQQVHFHMPPKYKQNNTRRAETTRASLLRFTRSFQLQGLCLSH